MNLLIQSCVLSIVAITFIRPSYGQELDDEVLRQIFEAADKICDNYWRGGSESASDLSGSAELEIKGILSKIAELDVAGSVGFNSNEYYNVIREQLGSELNSVRECRIHIWDSLEERLTTAKQDAENTDKRYTSDEIISALDWYDAKCPRLKLLIPFGAGGKPDMAARIFSYAFTDSGMRQKVQTSNYRGMHKDIDSLFNEVSGYDGCSLAIVRSNTRGEFPLPYMNIKIRDKWYSTVLPSGIVTEVAERWKVILYKIETDPDFKRRMKDLVVDIEYTVDDLP